MPDYFNYDTTTGRVLSMMSSPELPIDTPGAVLAGAITDPNKIWVNGGTVTEKIAMALSLDKSEILADGVDFASLSGIPAGASIVLDGLFKGIVKDGVAEFTSNVAKALSVKVSLFPYLNYEVTINAN